MSKNKHKSRSESAAALLPGFLSKSCSSDPPIVPDVSHLNKCGVMWVKFPAGSRGNSWRVWTAKFVGIKSELILRPDSVSTGVLLLVHRTEKADSEVIFKRRLSSNDSIFFRSKSVFYFYTIIFTKFIDF